MYLQVLIIVGFILMWFLVNIGLVSFLRKKSSEYDILKYKAWLAPPAIVISLIAIYLTDITWAESGFQIGTFNLRLLIAIAVGVAFSFFQFRQVWMLSREELKELLEENPKTKMLLKSDPRYIAINTLVFAGLVEEIFFRGFLQGHLQRFMTGDILTIGYSAIIIGVIFGLIHLISVRLKDLPLKAELRKTPYRILLGVLLGYIFQVSQSLIFPILIHNLVDSSTLLLVYRLKD